jgi:Na+-transporting NADH:ubiquinone oxidoreductase subunit NqrE
MVDWGDAETFWLNVTNVVLGFVTLIAFVAVVGAVFVEVLERLRKRVTSTVEDAHTLSVPVLGTTMADGGERLDTERAETEEEEERDS